MTLRKRTGLSLMISCFFYIGSTTSTSLLIAATGLLDSETPSGYLGSKKPNDSSLTQDESIHGSFSERKYLLWKHIHEQKSRVYQNLEKGKRIRFRIITAEVMEKLWTRGVMNDLYRIIQLLYEYRSWQPRFKHDTAAQFKPPTENIIIVDERAEVAREYKALYRRLMSITPGERLIPLTNQEHFSSMPSESLKAFSGLGSLALSYPEKSGSLIKRRLERHYRWAEDYDKDRWKQVLKDYAKEQREMDFFLEMLGKRVIHFGEKMFEQVEELDENSLFVQKQKFFDRAFKDMDVKSHISQAIALLSQAETQQAAFAMKNKGCGAQSRNQMSGLCMRIGSLLKAFLDHPSLGALLKVGSFGVIGTPLLLDANYNGRADLKDDHWLPDGVARESATVSFDLDGDGFAEAIEWMAQGDALICSDLNDDGRISDGWELFGTTGGWESGFHKLQSYDLDGSNSIEGEELAPLLLWFDDGDGISEDRELLPIREYGIESISTQSKGRRGRAFASGGKSILVWDWYTEYYGFQQSLGLKPEGAR